MLRLALATLFGLAFGRAVAESPASRPERLVAVEIRFLAVPPRLAEGFAKGRPVTLDAAQLRALLEAVQGDVRATVLHHLKVTIADGQQFAVREAHQEESDDGVEVSVLPSVSADRHSVRLVLKAELMPVTHSFVTMRPREGSTIAVNETFTAPDGRTVVFEAAERVRPACEMKVPVFGDVPCLRWLVTTMSSPRQEERVLILVTPSIVPR